jgi:predicted AAA+ superfamily ATPase
MHIRRRLQPPGKSFLLLGPRGTGKSTWLAETLPQALTIDLLDSSRFLELSSDPTALLCLRSAPRA